MAGKIFINYRRDNDSGATGRLFDRLREAFRPERLFMDVDSIGPGLDFVKVIDKQVSQCDVLLAIIGKGWVGSRDVSGARRLDNPGDFVRVEIEAALARGKLVIPVLVGGASMPSADELPEPIRALARHNAVRLTHERFHADMLGLIKVLQGVFNEAETFGHSQTDAIPQSQAEKERFVRASAGDPPLLEVRDLSIAFRQGDRTSLAVERISFKLEAGRTLALVGESGSGKSVTALSIVRLLGTTSASFPTGEIFFKGENLLAASEAHLQSVRGKDITMVFQEPMSSLNPLHTIERQVGEILELHGMRKGAKMHARIVELLEEVGIVDPAGRLNAYPHQLSGGQRQRVMIAMALANRPELFIADEPTTALDVTVQAQILTLLADLQTKLGMALLFITHDLGIVRKLADDVAVMQRGRIVETGPVADIFSKPRHPYTRALLAAEPKGEPPAADASAPAVVTAEDLKVWFPVKRGFLRRTVGYIKAVDGVSFVAREGQTIGIVGESGSGKTTLGLAVLRLVRSEGPIAYLGRRIDGWRSKQMRPLRRDMQIVFQDPYGSLSPRLSIAGIVEEGLIEQNKSLTFEERREIVARALADTGLDPAAMDRYPHEFSGGQRQRIAIARAMALEPKFVVLDEPTSALDMSVQAQIVDLLRELQRRRGLTYMFISHDLKVVRALATDIIVLRYGKVVEAGPAVDIFRDPASDYTRALFKAAFDIAADTTGAVNQ